MKGIRATKPRLEVVQQVFKTLVELTENRPEFAISCAFEYIPLAKACSVAKDATPCARLPYNDVLVTVRWPENTEENLKFARDASRKLTDVENTVYGNYGALVFGYVKDRLTDSPFRS